MKLHARTLPVQAASGELRLMVATWQERHDLTDVEALHVLLDITSGRTKYMLRAERHPDDVEKKADEA